MDATRYTRIAIIGIFEQAWRAATQLIYGGISLVLLSVLFSVTSLIYGVVFSVSSMLSQTVFGFFLAELFELFNFLIVGSVLLSIGLLRLDRDPPDVYYRKLTDPIVGVLCIGSGLWIQLEAAKRNMKVPTMVLEPTEYADLLGVIMRPTFYLFILGIFTVSTGLILLGVSRLFLFVASLSLPRNITIQRVGEIGRKPIHVIRKAGKLHDRILKYSQKNKISYPRAFYELLDVSIKDDNNP